MTSDDPPSYAPYALLDESPAYSRTPLLSEVTVRSSSDLDSCISGEEYVYRSMHLELNLGPKVWGTKVPAYGLDANVQGKILLSGELKKVSHIVIELEGRVATTFWERGLAVGAAIAKVVSSTISITPPVIAQGTSFEEGFSIPFPTYADGRRSKLPPSAIMYLAGATCEIKYRLKVKVVRYGLYRKNESLKVAVLYLPRSYAKQPIPSSLPKVVPTSTSELLSADSDVKTIFIEPRYKSSASHARDVPVVHLTLPSSRSFAYHETIPVNVSVISTSGSAVHALLFSSAKIHLVKRNTAWNKGRPHAKLEVLVGVAECLKVEAPSETVSVLSGKLRVADADPHQSWSVEDLAEQQYFIRVLIRPPASTAPHIPSFEYEHPVELTTDAYDSLEREAASLTGSSSPALVSLAALRHNV